MAKTVFYARVSTRDQNPSLQTDAAKQLGVKSENIFVEKASGSRNDRPVLARERTRAGLAAAHKRGKRLGPPIKWQPDMAKRARELLASGELTSEDIARMLKVSPRTLFRGLKAAREHDEVLVR